MRLGVAHTSVAVDRDPASLMRSITSWAAGMSGCSVTVLSPSSVVLTQSSLPNVLVIGCLVGTVLAVIGGLAWIGRAIGPHGHLDPSWLAIELLLVALIGLMWILVAVWRSDCSVRVDLVTSDAGTTVETTGLAPAWWLQRLDDLPYAAVPASEGQLEGDAPG